MIGVAGRPAAGREPAAGAGNGERVPHPAKSNRT